jgi:hypothetical protein
MKVPMILLVLAIALSSYSCARTIGASSTATAPAKDVRDQTRVNFEKDIQPIFKARCQNCHFPGGRMYDKLPFDKEETIRKLGTKLFTRIRDEQDQKLIKQFLAQS